MAWVRLSFSRGRGQGLGDEINLRFLEEYCRPTIIFVFLLLIIYMIREENTGFWLCYYIFISYIHDYLNVLISSCMGLIGLDYENQLDT